MQSGLRSPENVNVRYYSRNGFKLIPTAGGTAPLFTGCARPFSIAVPDDEGIFVKAGVGLGMRRLQHHRPGGRASAVFNEDKTIWICFQRRNLQFSRAARRS